MTELKTKIVEFRRKQNITQGELADRVGVRRETIVRLERGQYNPSLKLAYDIANVFGVPIEEVFRNRQISRRIKKHLWLSNRSWARDVHSFGILHSWGALAGKSCSAQASSIWLIAGAFRRTQSK